MDASLMAAASLSIGFAAVQITLFVIARSFRTDQGGSRSGLFGGGYGFLVNAGFFLATFWRFLDGSTLAVVMQNVSGLLALLILLLSIWQMMPGSFGKSSVIFLILTFVLVGGVIVTGLDRAGRVHVAGIIFTAVFVEVFRVFMRGKIGHGYVLNYVAVAVTGIAVFLIALRSMLIIADPGNVTSSWFLFYASVPACLTILSIILLFAEFVRHREQYSLLSNRDRITGLSNWYGAKHAFNAVQNILQRQQASYGVVVLSMQLSPGHMNVMTGTMREDFRNGMALAVAAHLRIAFRSSDIICEYDEKTWMVILPESQGDLVEMIGQRLLEKMQASDLVLGNSFVNPDWFGAGAIFDATVNLDDAFAACRFEIDRRKSEGRTEFGYLPNGSPAFSPGN